MAQYKVKAPDGQIITLEGPDGASQEEIFSQAQKLYVPKQQEQKPKETSFWENPLAGIKGGIESGVATFNLAMSALPAAPWGETKEQQLARVQKQYQQANESSAKSGTLGQVLGSVPAAMTGVLPAQAMTQKYMDLTNAGVDNKTAAKAAATSFGVGAVSNLVPVGRGFGLGTVLGGTTSVAGSVVDRQTTANLIQEKYPELASQYRGELKDYVKEGIIGAGIGGILGAITHGQILPEKNRIIPEQSTTPTPATTPQPQKPTVSRDVQLITERLAAETAKPNPRKGVIKKLESQLAEYTTKDIDAQKPTGRQYNLKETVPTTLDENGMPIFEPQSEGINRQVSVDKSIPLTKENIPETSALLGVQERLLGSVGREEKALANYPWLLNDKVAAQEIPNFLRNRPTIPEHPPILGEVLPEKVTSTESTFTTKSGEPITFNTEVNGDTGLTVATNSKGDIVGRLEFSTKDQGGYIPGEDVSVSPEYQRNGIATEMYNHAEKNGGLFPEATDQPEFRTEADQGLRNAMALRGQRGSVNTGFSEGVVGGFKRIADYFKKDREGNPLTPEETKTVQAAYRGEVQPNDPKFIDVAIKTPDLPESSKITSTLVSSNIYALQKAASGKHLLPEVFYTKYNKIAGDISSQFTRMFGERVASDSPSRRMLILGKLNPDSFLGRLTTETHGNRVQMDKLAGEFANIQMRRSRGEQVEVPPHLQSISEAYNKSTKFALDEINKRRVQLGFPEVKGIEDYITSSGHKEFYYQVKRPDGSLVETNFQHVSPNQLEKNLPYIKELLAKNGEDPRTLDFQIIRRSGEFTNDSAKLAHAFSQQNPAKAYTLESKRMLSDLDLPPSISGRRLLENQNNYADAVRKYVQDMEFQIQTKDLRAALEKTGLHENTLDWVDKELRPSMTSSVPNNRIIKDAIRSTQNLVETLSEGSFTLPQHYITAFIRGSSMGAYTKVLLSMNQAIQGFLGLMKTPGHLSSMMARYGVDMSSSIPSMSKAIFDYAVGSPRAKELSKLLYERGELDQMIHSNDLLDTGNTRIFNRAEKAFDITAQILGKPDQMARYLVALTLDNSLMKSIPDVNIRNNIIANEITRVLPDMRVFSKPTAFKRAFGQVSPLITALDTYYAHFWGYALSNINMAANRRVVTPLVLSTIVPMLVAGPKASEIFSLIDSYTNASNAFTAAKEFFTGEYDDKEMTVSDKLVKWALQKYETSDNEYEKNFYKMLAGGVVDAIANRDLSKAVVAPSIVPTVGYPIQYFANVEKNIPGTIAWLTDIDSRGSNFRDAIALGRAALPSAANEPLLNLEQNELGAASHLVGRGTKTRPGTTGMDQSDAMSLMGYKTPENKLKQLNATERALIEQHNTKYMQDIKNKAFDDFLSNNPKDSDRAIKKFVSIVSDDNIPLDVRIKLYNGMDNLMSNAVTTKSLTEDAYILWKNKIITEMKVQGGINDQ